MLHVECLVHHLAGLAYKQAVGLLGANVLGNFTFQLEWVYVIMVNILFYNRLMSVCLSVLILKQLCLSLQHFCGPARWLHWEMITLHTSPHRFSFKTLLLYSFSERVIQWRTPFIFCCQHFIIIHFCKKHKGTKFVALVSWFQQEMPLVSRE